MESSFSSYDYTKSLERIDEILNTSDTSYEDHKGIPSRDNLTFLNGYNVDVTVLFVDLRDSTGLSNKHTKPVLAKIYRSYISETVAIFKGNKTISEIYIEGDGVWGVFNTTTKVDVDSVFETAGRVSSLVKILNIKLSKKNYSTISVGIGIEDGYSLYIKAGYKGSGINEVVWVGSVVGKAAGLCKNANRTIFDKSLMVSEAVYSNLCDKYKGFLRWNDGRCCYEADIVNTLMDKWVHENG